MIEKITLSELLASKLDINPNYINVEMLEMKLIESAISKKIITVAKINGIKCTIDVSSSNEMIQDNAFDTVQYIENIMIQEIIQHYTTNNQFLRKLKLDKLNKIDKV